MCVCDKNGVTGSSWDRYKPMPVGGCRAVVLTPQLHENFYLESVINRDP